MRDDPTFDTAEALNNWIAEQARIGAFGTGKQQIEILRQIRRVRRAHKDLLDA